MWSENYRAHGFTDPQAEIPSALRELQDSSLEKHVS